MKRLVKYQNYLYRQELSEATIKIYLRVAGEFLDYTGKTDIDKTDVLSFKRHLERSDLAAATVNQHIIAVNRYLRYRGHSDCAIKTERIQRHTSVTNVINEYDYYCMLIYAKEQEDDKYYAIMKTLALTGIRVSELAYIKAENIEAGHITVHNKGKIREIFLPDCLIGLLKKYCEGHGIKEGCIFRGNTGKPISRVAVWEKLNRIAEKAGIDRRKAHPHSFRHYFAQHYLKRYSNLFELADILGHASLETTRIYAMATVEEKRERMGQLDIVSDNEIQYSVKNVKCF